MYSLSMSAYIEPKSFKNLCYRQQSPRQNYVIRYVLAWDIHKLVKGEKLPNNKLDIIICDNEERTCMLIDVAIPGDRNVNKKE
jgi:hypothetical protein